MDYLMKNPSEGHLMTWNFRSVALVLLFAFAIMVPLTPQTRAQMGSHERHVTQLYFGYFGRGPSSGELVAMVQNMQGGWTRMQVSQHLASQPAASTSSYSDESDAMALLIEVYHNLFDRDPDPGGLAFWTSVLMDGNSASATIVDIIDGASPSDRATLSAKVNAHRP
jgi:hypothetical protein